MISEDNQSSRIDPVLQETLNNEVYQLWRAAKFGAKGLKDNDKTGMENYSTLSLIEETENILNKYFEEFSQLQNSKEFSVQFTRIAK